MAHPFARTFLRHEERWLLEHDPEKCIPVSEKITL